MNIQNIQFPIEGNVQNLAHFIDKEGDYAFTFASPFSYTDPQDLKDKGAFLLAKYNQMKKKATHVEAIYAAFIPETEKKPYMDPLVKAAVKTVNFYNGEGEKTGSIDILLQKGFFRSYSGMALNRVYDASGKVIAFCHYNDQQHSKDIYTFTESFQLPTDTVTAKQIAELEAAGSVHRVFSYDFVPSDDADNKDRLLAIFSPQKKSELTNNRVRFFGSDRPEEQQEMLLTALFAFFWQTYVDIPM